MNTSDAINNPSSLATRSANVSRERLQAEADRLFSIGWLIKRLMNELRSMMLPNESVSKHPMFFYSLRDNYERWFVWNMLHSHEKTLSKVREILLVLSTKDDMAQEVMDERKRAILLFVKMIASKRWDMLQDDDQSWRQYAKIAYSTMKSDTKTTSQFFDTVCYIAMLTEVLCGRAGDYYLDPSDADKLKLKAFLGGTQAPAFLVAKTPEVGLKQLLSGEWFSRLCRNADFDDDWCELLVDELLKSEHGEMIADEWKDRSQLMMALVVASLKDAGIFKKVLASSNLSVATEILTPYYPDPKELKKKASTFSNYMGKAKTCFFHDWVINYVRQFD